MAKKTEEKVKTNRVEPIHMDFSREDMNAVVAKLNEVIAVVNNL